MLHHRARPLVAEPATVTGDARHTVSPAAVDAGGGGGGRAAASAAAA
jgi:hypothetical protein